MIECVSVEYVTFYKVIVIKVDVFESSIVDERHFTNSNEAHTYANAMSEAGYLPVLAIM